MKTQIGDLTMENEFFRDFISKHFAIDGDHIVVTEPSITYVEDYFLTGLSSIKVN